MPSQPPTYDELLEQYKDLQRTVNVYQSQLAAQPTISTPTIRRINRPQGEAGSRRRGFNLFEAMQMDQIDNGEDEYDRMRHHVRNCCIRVQLNTTDHYKRLDPGKLGQVFTLAQKAFPYLTNERFPHYWATAEMVKGYVAGVRKAFKKQMREELEKADKGQDDGDSNGGANGDGEDDGEDDDSRRHNPPAPTTASKTQRRRFRDPKEFDDIYGDDNVSRKKPRIQAPTTTNGRCFNNNDKLLDDGGSDGISDNSDANKKKPKKRKSAIKYPEASATTSSEPATSTKSPPSAKPKTGKQARKKH
ncbi:hypothetical protein BDN70DRAFT_889204 [Pholiota conissans]|uniref:Uncharacterized protein n=1 Tax=Pholiota conissans TaxID=109636 RepID=A0A9P6CQI1_9AGAR|nr:hypothetical protein BDN70DRAFT_889204 [Pholiota conissans]